MANDYENFELDRKHLRGFLAKQHTVNIHYSKCEIVGFVVYDSEFSPFRI